MRKLTNPVPVPLLWLLLLLLALSGSLSGCGGKCPCAANSPGSTAAVPAAGSANSAATPAGSAAAHWEQNAAKIPVSPDDPAWGRFDAPVTIVEFSDLQCPFCNRVEPTLARIKSNYGADKVRLVFLHNPLTFHAHAYPAAVAAATVQALAGSDAFFKFIQLAYAHQGDGLTEDNFAAWAVASGVDAGAFHEALKNQRGARKVDADMALAKQLGATGTPAFRINGITLVGAQPYEKFAELIEQQLAAAKQLTQQGTAPAAIYVTLTNQNFAAPSAESDNQADAPSKEDQSVWKMPVMADDPVRGATDAKVTVVVFSDFECPFCGRVEGTLKQVREHYKEDVRIVWKDYPLPFHKSAMPAAVLGRLVLGRRGNAAFWSLHDRLFEAHPGLTHEELTALAAEYKIPWSDVESATNQGAVKERIEASAELASDFNAQGTPNFFINGVRLSGAQPYEKFEERIDAELARANVAIKAGTARSKLYRELIKDGKEPPAPERKEAALPAAGRPSLGPANAAVVVQQWSDFQCPFCQRVQPALAALRKEFPTQVRIVWRHFPLPFHAQAPLAAEAAEEVLAQKGNAAFWAYHDRLFALQADENGLSAENLEKAAAELGVDRSKFRSALDSHAHRAKLDADMDAAKAIDINGTPAFVINGYYVSGAQPLAAFRRVVRRALDDKKQARK